MYCKYLHGLGDVFERLRTQSAEGECELAFDLVVGLTRNANSPALGYAFEACRNVHAVAVDVALVDNNVTEVHANAKCHSAVVGGAAIADGHSTLNLRRAFDRFDHAAELGQKTVAHQFDDATVMLGYGWGNQFGMMGL
jgi:hypothetical protein